MKATQVVMETIDTQDGEALYTVWYDDPKGDNDEVIVTFQEGDGLATYQ